MKGDFTRNTFKKEKPYSDVRMQQGRVQFDADWNEQVDIQNHRIETETTQAISACSVTLHTLVFNAEFTDARVSIWNF